MPRSANRTAEISDTASLILTSGEATTAFGARLAATLAPGDCVLLFGQLGAGKSHLARSLIRVMLGDPTASVASPTYTLVNVYDAVEFEIWHADLYRLNAADEIIETGLDDAAATKVLLVEWADRWTAPPARRLEINLHVTSDSTRRADLTAVGDGWEAALGDLQRT